MKKFIVLLLLNLLILPFSSYGSAGNQCLKVFSGSLGEQRNTEWSLRLFRDRFDPTVFSALEAGGIGTINQLTEKTKEDLLKVPGIDSSGAKYVKSRLKKIEEELNWYLRFGSPVSSQ